MQQIPGLLWVPMAVALSNIVIYVIAYLLIMALPSLLAIFLSIFAACLISTTIVTGQGVIIHRVAASVDGRSETNSEAFAAVSARIGDLIRWGSLLVAVRAIISMIERGRGLLGLVLRLFAFALSVAWSAMTFFVVPVIIFEGLGTKDAMRRSRELLRASWGEGIVGVGILTLIFYLAIAGTFFLATLFAAAGAVVISVLLLIVALVGIALISSVASPVFTFVLYRFATSGQAVLGFTPQDLAAAFRTSKRFKVGSSAG